MSVITNNTIQPSSGQSLTIKDEGGTASITVATNGEATFAENIVIGTAGHGIDFSNQSAHSGATEEVLDGYEFGSWTPIMGGQNQTTCYYCKVGRMVMLQGDITLHGSTSTTFAMTNLPFNATSSTYGTVTVGYVSDSRSARSGYIYPASNRLDFTTPTGIANLQAGDNIYFTAHFITD